MTFDVIQELESNFLDELRREICAPEDEQASSGTRKRPISDMNDDDFYDLSKEIDESNKRPMQQKTQRIDEGCSYVQQQTFVEEAEKEESSSSPPKLSGDDSSNKRFSAADLHDARANVTTKSPLTRFNELEERVYQAADENMKQRRNPIDDLAKDIDRDFDFDYPLTMFTGFNALDTFARNAYQSNESDICVDKEKIKWGCSWRLKFEELRNYKEAHGDCPVPHSHPILGAWLYNQRTNYRLLKEGKDLQSHRSGLICWTASDSSGQRPK